MRSFSFTETKVQNSTKQVTPIQTSYKGYRFRSRLEARWAVFFDAAGVKWEYEPEGFALGDAGAYLPDFWLHDLGVWCEIKPEAPTDSEIAKAEALFFATGKAVCFLIGTPGDHQIRLFCNDLTDSSGGTGWWYSETQTCTPGILLMLVNDNLKIVLFSVHGRDLCGGDYESIQGLVNIEHAPESSAAWPAGAVAAARSARFEHGARGAA